MALNGYGFIEVTPPAGQVITLAAAKKQLEIFTGNTLHDDQIGSLIDAVVSHFEKVQRVHLRPRESDLVIDCFPDEGVISIPVWPVSSVASISYVDADGNNQVLDPSMYKVSTHKMPCQIAKSRLLHSWPTTADEPDAVTIRVASGFEVADVPKDLWQSLLLLLAHWFENREAVVIGTISGELPLAVKDVWDGYKLGDGFLRVSG